MSGICLPFSGKFNESGQTYGRHDALDFGAVRFEPWG